MLDQQFFLDALEELPWRLQSCTHWCPARVVDRSGMIQKTLYFYSLSVPWYHLQFRVIVSVKSNTTQWSLLSLSCCAKTRYIENLPWRLQLMESLTEVAWISEDTSFPILWYLSKSLSQRVNSFCIQSTKWAQYPSLWRLKHVFDKAAKNDFIIDTISSRSQVAWIKITSFPIRKVFHDTSCIFRVTVTRS